MATSKLKQAWKKSYVQPAIMLIIIILVVVGLWFGSQAALGTSYPALAVASGSMCRVGRCDGWSHPFAETLHVGDLIVVQGIDPKQVKTALYPDGDIIVFHKPQSSEGSLDELIVHRAIANLTYEDNGLVYFRTKGDGNGPVDMWSSDYRGLNYSGTPQNHGQYSPVHGMISEKMLVGRVVMRIPWVGHLALFMRNSSGVYLILALIIILVVVEFVVPAYRKKTSKPVLDEDTGNPLSET